MLIKLTTQCQMQCPHCMEDAQPTGLMMTLDTFRQAVKFGTYIGCSHFVLSGSEATEALATSPTTGRVSMNLMKKQEKMIDSLLRAADTLRGKYGLMLAKNLQVEYRRRRESGELPKPYQPEPSSMTILQECNTITEALSKKVSARDFRISSQDIVDCAGLSGSFEMGFCEGIIVALDCLHPLDREAALREICNGIKASATDKRKEESV